jgi:hypothetical protein
VVGNPAAQMFPCWLCPQPYFIAPSRLFQEWFFPLLCSGTNNTVHTFGRFQKERYVKIQLFDRMSILLLAMSRPVMVYCIRSSLKRSFLPTIHDDPRARSDRFRSYLHQCILTVIWVGLGDKMSVSVPIHGSVYNKK